MRLSSRRLKVTRLGGGFAAAGRAAARSSLGSVFSDILLMQRLLITLRRSCFGRVFPTLRGRHATDMIAPTAVGCKRHPINTPKGLRFCRTPTKSRVTGSLGTSYCCPTSANRLPCPFEIYDSALTRSFRFRIPQPPAPRGRQDRVYRKGLIPEGFIPETGPTKVGPFLFWNVLFWTCRKPNVVAAYPRAKIHCQKNAGLKNPGLLKTQDLGTAPMRAPDLKSPVG